MGIKKNVNFAASNYFRDEGRLFWIEMPRLQQKTCFWCQKGIRTMHCLRMEQNLLQKILLTIFFS